MTSFFPKFLLPVWFLVLILPSFMADAQSRIQAGIRFIPQAPTFLYDSGFPLQDILKDAPYYFRVRTAQGAGVLYQFHPRWSLGGDVLYSLQGGGYESRKTNLNYLKIPFWLGYNAASSRRLQFNVQTGIAVTLLLKACLRYSDGATTDISSYLNRTNWGIPLAIGIKCKVGKAYRLNTQLLLYTGMQSLAKTNPAFTVRDYILPGIRFSLDKNLSGKW